MPQVERRFRPVRKLIVLGFVVGFSLMLWAFLRDLRAVSKYPIHSWTEDAMADCAVVLTGGPNRVREGIDLLARKSVQKLIISGVHPNAGFRDIFPLWPYYGEIRDQDVILERRSRTTYGNAQQSYPLVEALRCRDLILVTSRVHMHRALQTFKAEFPPDYPIIPYAVPSNSFEPEWEELILETMKSLFYAPWAY